MSTKKEATNYSVIVGYCRTAFAKTSMAGSGKAPGVFGDVDPVDMQVPLVNELLDRSGVDPKDVKKILTGAVHQEYTQGLNIARLIAMHKDCKLENSTGGTTLDRFCGSSMEAIAMADGFIARNPNHVYICTGVQSMSQVPMGGINPHLADGVMEGNAAAFMDMPTTAENLRKMYNISSEEMSSFAAESHRRLKAAQENGHFKNEIVSLKGLDLDDGGRFDTTTESLESLRAKKPGAFAAATSSQITDGASAVMVTSEAFAADNNLPVLARIISFGESGLAPEIMGLGPVEAAKDALQKAGLSMDDMDVIELNEAFAAQSLAVLKEWDKQGMGIDPAKVNVDGGAISMGHPLGASGARIVGHVAEVLQRENKRYGLATMCIGGGQGVAMIVENPNAAPKPGM
ncbi:MAG: thiolase family protein [Rhodospirillales bacterium]|nr:thiolase family protein [Rhodospirillales bacterium]MCB9995321.1 thiolase family protein [Rhodospirillales bacterium]